MANETYGQDEVKKVLTSCSKQAGYKLDPYVHTQLLSYDLPSEGESFTTLDPDFLAGQECIVSKFLQNTEILEKVTTIADQCNRALSGSKKSVTLTDVAVGILLSQERYNYEANGDQIRLVKVHGKSNYLIMPVWVWYPVYDEFGRLIGFIIIIHRYVFSSYWNATNNGFGIMRTKPEIRYLQGGIISSNLEDLDLGFDYLAFREAQKTILNWLMDSKIAILEDYGIKSPTRERIGCDVTTIEVEDYESRD